MKIHAQKILSSGKYLMFTETKCAGPGKWGFWAKLRVVEVAPDSKFPEGGTHRSKGVVVLYESLEDYRCKGPRSCYGRKFTEYQVIFSSLS